MSSDVALGRLNDIRLRKVHHVMRPVVEQMLAELREAGYRPRIQESWRSPQEQVRLYGQGRTRPGKKVTSVLFGAHNCTSPDGHPEALAVDIIDDDALYQAPYDYWFRQAAAAIHAGKLKPGAFFFRQSATAADKKTALHRAIGLFYQTGQITKVELGWDKPHVEWAGLTYQQMRSGQRPT